MSLQSINPATGELLAEFSVWDGVALERALASTAAAARGWRARPIGERGALLRAVAGRLRERRDELARLASLEMGKPIKEARAEVEKSAWGCEYYADHAAGLLAPEPVGTDASKSYVAYEPLGTVLAIMPWNFPFWQAFRAMAPILAGGNTFLLKHAPNVPQCARAIEEVVREAGVPEGVVVDLPIDLALVEHVIADARVHAVTLTGSERAGRAVAALAGANLKKAVLELGGSDPFIVLEDADLALAARVAVTARFQNGGQSCIAAKRFILVDTIAEDFMARFKAGVERLVVGDPLEEQTQIGPIARADLRDGLDAQVQASVRAGARVVTGGKPLPGPGFFYAPTILDAVAPGMPAYDEELFGPVASVIRVRDEQEAVAVANASRYGLGGSVWTGEVTRGERVARALESGAAFVNGMTKSDPRLPFGGVKCSGFGRELSHHGLREFTNVKTVWIR